MDEIDLVPLIRQHLAWDMLPYDHDYWQALDLMPPGPDVAEKAQADSRSRMGAVARYQVFVNVYAVLCADIITEVMYQNLRDQIDGAEEGSVMKQVDAEGWHKAAQLQNREIVRGSVYPILAHMLESGVLKHGEVPRELLG